MKATLIGTESMVGVSKKSGNPYEIYTLRLTMPVNTKDKEVSTADWTRKKEGSVVLEQQVNEAVYNRARNIAVTGYPIDVDLEMEQRLNGSNQLVNDCVDIHAENMPPKLAKTS